MYADDLVMFCPSSREIMRNKSCKNVQFPSFMLNNEMLLEAEFVKYLASEMFVYYNLPNCAAVIRNLT